MDEMDRLAALRGNTHEWRRHVDRLDDEMLRKTWEMIDRSREMLARLDAWHEFLWRGLPH
jgi:hypothetical protein